MWEILYAIEKLRNKFSEIQILTCKCIHLSMYMHMYMYLNLLQFSHKGASLKTLAKVLLGKDLNKSRHITQSNWEASSLSDEQVCVHVQSNGP